MGAAKRGPTPPVRRAAGVSLRAGVPSLRVGAVARRIVRDHNIGTVHWLLNLDDSDYFWSGDEDLIFEGVTYTGAGKLIAVSEARVGEGSEINISLQAADPTLRESLLRQNNPIPIAFGWVFSKSKGLAWERLPLTYRGYLSGPVIVDGIYNASIGAITDDVRRRGGEKWSAETQRERFSNDPGMDGMKQIGQGLRIGWPP